MLLGGSSLSVYQRLEPLKRLKRLNFKRTCWSNKQVSCRLALGGLLVTHAAHTALLLRKEPRKFEFKIRTAPLIEFAFGNESRSPILHRNSPLDRRLATSLRLFNLYQKNSFILLSKPFLRKRLCAHFLCVSKVWNTQTKPPVCCCSVDLRRAPSFIQILLHQKIFRQIWSRKKNERRTKSVKTVLVEGALNCRL